MLRLIVHPDPMSPRIDPPTSRGSPLRFVATLDGDFVVLSHQPLVDGARELLARGIDPSELLTMRHHDRPYDSFTPRPVSEWAKWTCSEPDRAGLRLTRWMPRPPVRDVAGSE